MAVRKLATLGFVITAACNLRCAYCYRAGEARAQMSWPVLERRLRVLLPRCGREVQCTFTGGEPLLAFPLLRRAVEEGEALAARGRQRIRWKLLTNGLLLDRDILAFLESHGFELNLSFDGVPAAQEARGPDTFRRLDGILKLIDREYPDLWEDRLQISMTVTPENLSLLASSVRYFLRRGVRHVNLTPAMGHAAVDWSPARRSDLEAQFRAVSRLMLRQAERTGTVPLSLYRKSVPTGRVRPEDWMCLAYRADSVTIDVDGRAYACVLATSSYRRAMSEGLEPAVRALDIGPVSPATLAGKRANVDRATRRAGVFQHPAKRYSSFQQCVSCEYLGRCQICPIAAATVPAWPDPRRVPDFLCAYNQVSLAHRDRFPIQPTWLSAGE